MTAPRLPPINPNHKPRKKPMTAPLHRAEFSMTLSALLGEKREIHLSDDRGQRIHLSVSDEQLTAFVKLFGQRGNVWVSIKVEARP